MIEYIHDVITKFIELKGLIMPTKRFTKAVREECVEHVLEAGNSISEVIKTLRHSRFDNIPSYHIDPTPSPGAQVFAEAIKVLEALNALKDSTDLIYIDSDYEENSKPNSSTDVDAPF